MRTTAAAILVVCLAPGCEEEGDAWKDDYSFVRHGEHVAVYGYDRDETDACAGSFDALDTQTQSVMDFLGVEKTAPFQYRWMSRDFMEGLCPPGIEACTSYGEPYARALPQMHEVVHMVGYQMPNTGCAPLLEEGLGEYLGGPIYWEGDPLDYDLRELMTVRENPGPRGYARAGHFVSFLVEGYGAQGFRRVCSAVAFGGSLDDWDAAVQEALGLSLDELIAQYNLYPECTQQQYRARLLECGGEPDFVFTAKDRSFVVHSGCDDSRAVNTAPGKLGDALLTRLVYFPKDTWVDVTPGPNAFMSQECAPCSAEPQVRRERENTLTTHHFRAGLHQVSLYFDRSRPAYFRMSALPD